MDKGNRVGPTTLTRWLQSLQGERGGDSSSAPSDSKCSLYSTWQQEPPVFATLSSHSQLHFPLLRLSLRDGRNVLPEVTAAVTMRMI